MMSRRLVFALVCVAACLSPKSSRAEFGWITIGNGRVQPGDLDIHVGDTVFIGALLDTFHIVQSDAYSPGCSTGPTCFRVQVPFLGGRPFRIDVFDQPGTFPFHCVLHGAPGGVGESGQIVVLPVPLPPPVHTFGRIHFSNLIFERGEAAGTATLSVERTSGGVGAVSVSYQSLAEGTATSGSDFAPVSGTLSWAVGELGAKTFDVEIFDDNLDEGDETTMLSLHAATGGALLDEPSIATVVIVDEESAPPCADGELQVCLLDRFLADIRWIRADGQSGEARVTKLSDTSAAFEFFEPGNVEVVLKMKDACALPPGNPLRSFWPFVAGLTNVGVELTILDTKTGATRRFYNEIGQPFFTPAPDSPDGKTNPPGSIQATLETLGAFATCDI